VKNQKNVAKTTQEIYSIIIQAKFYDCKLQITEKFLFLVSATLLQSLQLRLMFHVHDLLGNYDQEVSSEFLFSKWRIFFFLHIRNHRQSRLIIERQLTREFLRW
jgi:hypothetical protein